MNQTSTETIQAALMRLGADHGLSQAQMAEAFGVTDRTVRNRLAKVRDGRIPLPANVVGGADPGWDVSAEPKSQGHRCPRCEGELETGDYCMACNTYEGYEGRIKDELRIDRARAKAAKATAKFRPKGAEAGAVA